MKLNKPSKIVLGILTFLPLIFGITSFVIAIYQVMSLLFSEDPAMPLMLLSYLGYVIPYLFLFFLVYLGLGIFYIVHIVQNKLLDNEKRILWVIVLIAFNGIAMPIYWYVHIWKEHSSENSELNPGFDNPYESGIESQKF
jgi:hypothetical protein